MSLTIKPYKIANHTCGYDICINNQVKDQIFILHGSKYNLYYVSGYTFKTLRAAKNHVIKEYAALCKQ